MDPVRNAEIQREMARGAVPIRYVGGPADGRTARAQPHRLTKAVLVVETDEDGELNHVYKLKHTRSGAEYHFKHSERAQAPA